MRGTYLIISILVVVSDGSWSVDVGWSLVLRMLRNERRRRLKVEGDIIFLFFYIYLFFYFSYFLWFCWGYIRFRSRYARGVDGLRKKTRKFQKQEKRDLKG